MRKLMLLVAAAALVSVPAIAKPTTVKGAKCAACHQGAPKDNKWINKTTEDMVKKYKEVECKDCHGWEKGKLTTFDRKKK
ncbi:MAG: hypothetical protein BWY56_01338 [Acidobacteria bacterium ADurb.Bin340]|jgi:nitrate/TMAO reductase-like tetraheme cytochrome c subunit|nr:MAG: hypothetical protein BWY56_01338 [Acidobacteria bacterium ADurb.Bin340]HQL48058.1 cytochrome c3 family protein [Holophaga sp.]